MDLLRKLTLAYVAVLVPTLAVSLIAILAYLRRIADTLGEVRMALSPAARATEPLDVHLRLLQETSSGAADELAETRRAVEQVADRLGALTGRRG